jgi:hypothetical protein
MELEAQPRGAKQARVRVARERPGEAVAEQAPEAKRVRERPAETAAELEARQARLAPELGAQRQVVKPGSEPVRATASEQWPLAALAATSSSANALVNNYDGARSTTVSFDQGWKFHLGDVTGAQATTFDDSAWTSLDVPHDWSISLAFNQGSKAGGGGGYLDGGTGWYRKTFTLPAASSGTKGLCPVRRRLHGQHGVPQRHPNRRSSLRIFLVRM